MEVVIIYGKIAYGATLGILKSYADKMAVANTKRGTVSLAALAPQLSWNAGPPANVQHPNPIAGAPPIVRPIVTMTADQFLRFKCAGRRHAEQPKKNPLALNRQRKGRTNDDLGKWDVERYEVLQSKRGGPWGAGSATNRDHLLAHAENEAAYTAGKNPYGAANVQELKRLAWAVTISGQLHREGSMTYGGNSQTPVGVLKNRFRVTIPTSPAEDAAPMRQLVTNDMHRAAQMETESLLKHKADRPGRVHGTAKPGKAPSLRIEMVGAYAYLYKKLIDEKVMYPDSNHDCMLLYYLHLAVAGDKDEWRIDPAVVGKTPVSTQSTSSGTKYKV